MKNINYFLKIVLTLTCSFILNSCKDSNTESESEPLELILVATHISINGNSDGAIDLTVIGGNKPYQYQWSNGATSEDIDNLSVGTYTVTVNDDKNQTETASIEIKKTVPLNISLSKTDVSTYYGSDGSIDLTVTTGLGPFKFNWSNGDTTEDISNLQKGWYSVTASDFFEQVITDSAYINEPPLALLDTAHVTDDIIIIIEEQVSGGVNVSILSGSGGVLLIDSGYSNKIENLRQTIQAIDDKRITHIINTHKDDDHIGGNLLINQNDTIIGHLNGEWTFNNSNTDANFIGYSEIDSIFAYDEEILFYPTNVNGHTNTDLIIYFKNSKIVFMGDLYLSESFPSVYTPRGARVQHAITHLEFVQNSFPDANWIVPGHGRLSTMSELGDYITMVKETVDIVRTQMALDKDLATIISEDVLSDYSSWGTALVGLDTNFWITAIYWSYL